MTTHDLAKAEKLANRIIVLADCRIIADGTPVELMPTVSGTAELRWRQHDQHHIRHSRDATDFVRQLLSHESDAVTD